MALIRRAVSVHAACFLSLLCFFCRAASESDKYPYQVKYFQQYVDHFNQQTYRDKTYEQKYLFSDAHWTPGSGPIFFYTGNEGPVEDLWETFGFIHELASEFKALEVFAEHRYFGSSLPFGEDSLKTPYIGLLTFEQALADYAVMISDILYNHNCSHCKVITFGGSYGAMLAAYMRLKYPDLVSGALASSAPVSMQDPNGRRDLFYPQVTEDYREASEPCVRRIVEAFAMTEKMSKEKAGLSALSESFNLCDPMKTLEDYNNFLGWIRKAFVVMTMMDYPYANNILENLPANPVNASCKAMNVAENAIEGLRDLVGVYYNGSQTRACFNVSHDYVPCADPTGCMIGPDAVGWDYLACTELIMADSSNGVTDFFPNPPVDDDMRAEYCLERFGVQPRRDWTFVQFWGENLKSTSNIIFSNGDLDPWSTGGVLKDVSDTVIAILVHGGAHQLDLMPSHKEDPLSVIEARQREREIIGKWISN